MIGRRLAVLVLAIGPLACGTGASGDNRIGTVDLSLAPSTLTMSCGAGVTVALQMPCLIGVELGSLDPNAVGVHATECRLASPDQPIVWSFMFPLADVRAEPSRPLELPTNLPVAPEGQAIDLAGDSVTMAGVTGGLTFSRVDPNVRAFIGAFNGTVVWADQTGAQTACQMAGPFWGAPGNFM